MTPAPTLEGRAAPPTETPGTGRDGIPATGLLQREARGLVWIAAVFLVVVAGVMLYGQWVQPREEPWNSPELTAARARLHQEPKNEALKVEIRRLDQELRTAYFRGLERNRMGAWLLLLAGLGLVWTARAVSAGRRTPTGPAPVPAPASRDGDRARAQVTTWVCGGALAVFLALLGVFTESHLSRWETASGSGVAAAEGGAGTAAEAPAGAAPNWPSAERLAANWPQFLGSAGANRTASLNLPLTWNVTSGEGVRWKAPIPLPGYNSAIVWEDRVFLTGGDRNRRSVYCLDAATGELRWERPVTPTNAPPAALDPPDQSGQAASSAATDGERIFAVFATGELGALDFEGRLVWHKRLDFSENIYGHASSLAVWQDRLLVQADQGHAEDGKSQLLAFDTRTGAPLWAVKRPVGGSWTSPLVADVGGRTQVILAGDPFLMAYDPVAGGELWRAQVLGGELAPSPVLASNLVIAICPGLSMSGVRADGSGDVTASHVVWKIEEDVPDVPTPTVVGDLFFTASAEARLVCREVATGEVVWDRDLDFPVQASPLVSGNRIYLLGQPGNVLVLEAGREYRELASFEMGEEIFASPAVARDRLYLRTKSSLYCLGAADGAGASKVVDAGD